MEYELKRIQLASVVKTMFFVYLIVGFIGGIFYLMLMMNLISIMSSSMEFGDEVMRDINGLGFMGIIMMGMIFSIFTAVILTGFTALGIVTYNVVTDWFGGIKIELESNELEEVLYEEIE